MPGPILTADPRPDWAKPETRSVLDSPSTRALRWIAGITGIDNPSSSIAALMMPMDVGPSGGLAGAASKALQQFGETDLGRGLYSRIDDLLAKIPGRGAHPNKVRSLISGGASAEEAAYRRLPEFLASKGDQMVTREELAAHLQANPAPHPKEVVRGQPVPPTPQQFPVRTIQYATGRGRVYYAVDMPGGGQISVVPHREGWQVQGGGGTHASLDDALTAAQDQANRVFAARDVAGRTPQPKYQQYSLPGGENYREHLYTLPPPESARPSSGAMTPAEQYEFAPRTGVDLYRSGHWDEPNILVHARSTERTLPGVIPPEVDFSAPGSEAWRGPIEQQLGSRGRFLEEVQSDWHQAGKSQGYQQPVDPAALAAADAEHTRLAAAYNAAHDASEAARARLTPILQRGTRQFLPPEWQHLESFSHATSEGPRAVAAWRAGREQAYQMLDVAQALADEQQADAARYAASSEFSQAQDRLRALREPKGVPNAPFKETWPDLALKQQLLDVARSPDLDWLGFTSGQTQNARYSLANEVQQISWHPTTRQLNAVDHAGNNITPVTVDAEDLPRYIGHDATRRLLDAQPTRYGEQVLEGDDLRVGGAGMQHFYDQLLPARLQKLLKPFGGTVEPFTVPGTVKPGRYQVYVPMREGGAGAGMSRATGPEFPTREAAAAWRPQWLQQGATVEELSAPHPGDPGWLARLTPEIKQRILKQGFPLLSLLPAATFAPAAMRAFGPPPDDNAPPTPPPPAAP